MESVLYWLYVGVMVVGAALFVAMSRNPRGVGMHEYAVATFIPVWSAMAYLAMALGQGQLQVDGQTTYYARYLDWIVTTPLLLVALASTAMVRTRIDRTLVASLIFADVVMIVSGLVADLSPTPLRYLWYGVGVIALLALLWLVWGPLQARSRESGADVAAGFRRLAGVLSGLWLAYPTIWLLGPSGIDAISQPLESALFVFVPILSKVGWSYLDLSFLRSLGLQPRAEQAQPA